MKAVVLVSHGSRSSKTKAEIQGIIDELRQRGRVDIWGYAFLGIGHPNILDGIKECVQKGATEIVVLLNFLNSGKHVDADVPRMVDEARRKYPQIRFHITKPVGHHKQIVNLFSDMINEAFNTPTTHRIKVQA